MILFHNQLVQLRTQIRTIFLSRTTVHGYLCSDLNTTYYNFHYLWAWLESQSAHGITDDIQKRLDKLREIIDRVTLKQGRAKSSNSLLTRTNNSSDTIAHVVWTWMLILNEISRLPWNPLRCTYLRRLCTGVECCQVFFWFASLLIKKTGYDDKRLNTKATFGFYLLC